MTTKNTRRIVVETTEGSFYLKKQSITWSQQKPVFKVELTKSKAWALKTNDLTKDDIIREIHRSQPSGVIYAH